MNEAACIDCGVMSERRLPERFPHICTLCLFPPRPAAAEHADVHLRRERVPLRSRLRVESRVEGRASRR